MNTSEFVCLSWYLYETSPSTSRGTRSTLSFVVSERPDTGPDALPSTFSPHDVDLGEERGLFANLVLQTLLQGRFDRELDIHGRHAVAGGELVTHLIEFQAGILSHGTS